MKKQRFENQLNDLIGKVEELEGGSRDLNAAQGQLSELLRSVRRDLTDEHPILESMSEGKAWAKELNLAKEFAATEAAARERINRDEQQLLARMSNALQSGDNLFLLVLAACLFPALCAWLGSAGVTILSKSGTEVAGTIGDSFGMANAFLSGIALIFVAGTMYLQRKELMLQRNELRLTRDEMARNTKSQEEQAARLESSAQISAVSKIYDHYAEMHDAEKGSVKKAVVLGKKKWAIRTMFMLAESDEIVRKHWEEDDVAQDIRSLKQLLEELHRTSVKTVGDLRNTIPKLRIVAENTGILMADSSLPANYRRPLQRLSDPLWFFDTECSEINEGSTTGLSPEMKAWWKRFSAAGQEVCNATPSEWLRT